MVTAEKPIIDWRNGVVTKLGPCPIEEVLPDIAAHLVRNETVLLTFKAARDYLAFTDKRLIAVNLKGLSGRKRDYTSFPYGKYHVWSVETSGGLDQNAILEINLSVLAKVRFEFRGGVDIVQVGHVIASHCL
jgi:hypothetical protein